MSRDGLRYTRLGWWLGYYVGLWKCRVFGHQWKRYRNEESVYADVACVRCDEVLRDS